MRALRRIVAAALAGAALALAACGGDDEPADGGQGGGSARTGADTTTRGERETSTGDQGRPSGRERDRRGEGEGGGNGRAGEDAGGPGDGEAAAARTDAAGFVRGADAACRAATRALQRVQRELADLPDQPSRADIEARLERAIARQIEIYTATTERIARLEPPEGRADEVAELLRVRRKVAQVQRDYRRALERGRSREVAQLALRQARGERKAARLANDLGARAC